MSDNKHENYELLNLIGYGLAKFDMDFVKEFGFKTKTAFYEPIVSLKIAETTGVVKNRQDLFDPFFDSGRKGWWQKGDAYIHRKILIDSLFGDLNCPQYTEMVKIYIQSNFGKVEKPEIKQPASSEVEITTPEPEQEIGSPSVTGTTNEDKNIQGQEVQSQPLQSKKVLTTIGEKSESAVNDIYFIIAGLLTLVLLLTVFINIRVQYPRLIFTALVIIILIAGIASFNGQAFLNQGIDII